MGPAGQKPRAAKKALGARGKNKAERTLDAAANAMVANVYSPLLTPEEIIELGRPLFAAMGNAAFRNAVHAMVKARAAAAAQPPAAPPAPTGFNPADEEVEVEAEVEAEVEPEVGAEVDAEEEVEEEVEAKSQPEPESDSD